MTARPGPGSGGVTVGAVQPGDRAAVLALAGLRRDWARERGQDTTAPAAFVAAFVAWTERTAGAHTAFLARRADVPVGMGWLAVVERVPDVDRPVRRSGLVQSVFVLPAQRDRGLGEVLVTALLDHARRQDLDYVEVHPSERSFPFYRRLGFENGGGTLRLRLSGAAAPATGRAT